jgi:hypothetical protein
MVTQTLQKIKSASHKTSCNAHKDHLGGDPQMRKRRKKLTFTCELTPSNKRPPNDADSRKDQILHFLIQKAKEKAMA